jgi:hypothetical protein
MVTGPTCNYFLFLSEKPYVPLLQVVFYDASGRQMQVFDYSSDLEARDFSSCCLNPSGDTAVVGAFNRFYVYSLNSSRNTWEQVAVKQVRRTVPVVRELQRSHLIGKQQVLYCQQHM